MRVMKTVFPHSLDDQDAQAGLVRHGVYASS
jgi:hypothetical protein